MLEVVERVVVVQSGKGVNIGSELRYNHIIQLCRTVMAVFLLYNMLQVEYILDFFE
jgi:hypothetical protein